MIINPLLGFFAFTYSGPLLPQFYTDYYSQEDRLKAMSEVIQRQVAFGELTLEKVNEVIDFINQGGGEIPPDLLERIDALEAAVVGLTESGELTQDEVDALTLLVTALQGSYDSLSATVSNQGDAIDILEGSVDSLATTVDGFQTSIDDAVADSAEALTIAGGLDGRLTTVEGTVSTLSADVADAVAAVDTVETTVGTFDTRLTDLENDFGTIQTEVDGAVQDASDALTEAQSYSTRVTDLETGAATAASNISTLQTDVTTLDTTVDTLQTDVTTLDTTVGGFTASISGLETDVTALQGTVGILSGDVADAVTQVESLATEVSDLDAAVTAQGSSISTIEGDLSTVSTNASNALSASSTNATAIGSLESRATSVETSVSTIESTEVVGDVAINFNGNDIRITATKKLIDGTATSSPTSDVTLSTAGGVETVTSGSTRTLSSKRLLAPGSLVGDGTVIGEQIYIPFRLGAEVSDSLSVIDRLDVIEIDDISDWVVATTSGEDPLFYRKVTLTQLSPAGLVSGYYNDGRIWGEPEEEPYFLIPVLPNHPAIDSPITVYFTNPSYKLTGTSDLKLYARGDALMNSSTFYGFGTFHPTTPAPLVPRSIPAPLIRQSTPIGDDVQLLSAVATDGNWEGEELRGLLDYTVTKASGGNIAYINLYPTIAWQENSTEFTDFSVLIQVQATIDFA